MNRSLLLSITIIVCAIFNLNAQDINCNTKEAMESLFEIHPEAKTNYENFNQYTKSFIDSLQQRSESALPTYIIPVVFHVYGTNQNGAIVDYNTIVNSLNQVNEEFAGLNPDFNTVDPNFQSLRATMDIEFKLAKIDPNGNCTDGVIFHPEASGHGNYGSPVVANDSWDNYKYMNVYITADLYGDGSTTNSGVAWYPDTTMSDAGIARVVYNGQYLTGNTSQEFASVLTHEFGHWLNLIHTHEGGCSGTDEVTDTPQENVGGDCSETSDCGALINYENYMGYNGAAGCYKMFTQGQVNRMLAAMNHPARQPLWQPANISATGVNNTGGSALTNVTELLEDIANNGTVSDSPSITLNNANFALTGTLTEGVHFNSTSPAGMGVTVNVLNSTQATVTVTSNATNHNEANSSTLSVELLGPAISGGISNLPCNIIGWDILFSDPYQIIYVDNPDLTVNAGNVWEPFTDSFIPSLGGGTNYGGLFYNTGHPSGSPALQFETYTEAMVCNGSSLNISKLPENTLISTASNWVSGQAYPNLHDIRSINYTTWDGETLFAGFRFTKNGRQFHGWFRFQVAANGASYTLLDYAYSTEPYGDIYTGQQVLSTQDNANQSLNVTVSPNPFTDSITINSTAFNNEEITISVFNTLGQQVISKSFENVNQSIEITNLKLKSGMYFIKIGTASKQAIIKRVVKK